jgi:glyoxylase-like metal-dependent hydrolase (beta-lactamase superfamily II)
LEFATWLKGEFASRFGVPVKYVVYSHYHWDHASGGEVFADTAQFVGHANLLAYLQLPSESTTLSQVVGQYEPVAALDIDGSGLVELGEVPVDVQRFPGSKQSIFEGFDANKDQVLSGAEVVRGPLSYVYPPNITYTDEIEISLGGQRVNLLIVDYISFRLPNREMDYELGKFEGWMTAIRTTEEEAKKYKFVATGHGPVGTWEGVTVWRKYLEELRAEVESGITAGQSLAQMQQNIKMEKYSEMEGFDWVDENVLGMYHFLTD